MKSVLDSFYAISKNPAKPRLTIYFKNNICVSRKELMMFLMEYYTSYFISPEAHASTTQDDAVIKVNSFKTYETCSRQALVKNEDLIPVQVYVELSIY